MRRRPAVSGQAGQILAAGRNRLPSREGLARTRRLTESRESTVPFFARFRASPDIFKVGIGWTVLVLLVLIAGYGSVRVCPPTNFCEKGPRFFGWQPLFAALLVWSLGIAVLGLIARRAKNRRDPATEVEVQSRRASAGLAFALCGLTTLAVGHAFLLSPQIPHPFWAYPVHLSAGLGFPLNWDSPLLMDLAVSPKSLLRPGPGQLRQHRPLYIWMTAGLTRVLAPLARASGLARLYRIEHPAYLPSIVLNWCLLTVALFLFWRFLNDLGGRQVGYAAFLCAVPFLFNDTVKAFFWTPHMQFFNLLFPVLGLTLCRAILIGPSFPPLKVLFTGLSLGVLALAHGSALFLLPALVPALIMKARLDDSKSWSRAGLRPVLLALGFAIPLGLWMFVAWRSGGDYNDITIRKDRNFVWILDALRVGPGELLVRASSYFLLYARVLEKVCGLLAVFGVLLLFAALALGCRSSPSLPRRRQALIASLLMLSSSLALLYMVGGYAERFMFFVGPILLVICALWLTEVLERSRRSTRVLLFGALAGMAVLWVVYEVAKYGPYA